MSQSEAEEFESLRRAALDVTSGWPSTKKEMAMRALGLSVPKRERESLDTIAGGIGVSRETIRRARNELVNVLNTRWHEGDEELPALIPASPRNSDGSAATARALRRLLTMTGPLAWDEVLGAWARAREKYPYTPLPADLSSMHAWVEEAGGITINPSSGVERVATIEVAEAEELDQVSQFLYDSLRGRAGGVDRIFLLESAEASGLRLTTIATALSQHPAVMRLGRGTWALRGRRDAHFVEAVTRIAPRRPERVRPTTFKWVPDGSLVIEFSLPRGASPVVAVPKAVADLVEGRSFLLQDKGKQLHIKVGNARLWGFAPLVSEYGMLGGQRAQVELNLIRGIARFGAANGKDSPNDRTVTV